MNFPVPKIFLSLFVCLGLPSAFAVEIQCQTEIENTDFVVKTSESSGITYLLFLKGDTLDKYWPIPEGSFHQTETQFTFKDEQTSLEIELGGTGTFVSKPAVYEGLEKIKLSSCLLFSSPSTDL